MEIHQKREQKVVSQKAHRKKETSKTFTQFFISFDFKMKYLKSSKYSFIFSERDTHFCFSPYRLFPLKQGDNNCIDIRTVRLE